MPDLLRKLGLQERPPQAQTVPEDGAQLLLGHDAHTDEDYYLPLSIFGRTHLHVLGASGSGKSRLLLQLNQQLLTRDIPFAQFDIEGPLHDSTMSFLAEDPHLARNVIEFNLSDPQGIWPGLNPLARFPYSPRVSVQVEHLLAAFAKVWMEESKSTPLLRRMLRNTLYPLIEGGLTPIEADYFLDLGKSEVRRELARKTSNRRVKRDWDYFDDLSPARQLEQLGSLANRMAEFTDNEALKFVMRQKNVLDIQDIVENRKTLLVNLSQEGGWLYQDGAFLVACLLLTLFVSYAMTRSEEEGRAKPYFLILDEFQNFITPDIAKILDQCRKRGLYIVLAHQHLSQISEQDLWTYHSVLQNARIKAIFSLDDPKDLEIMEERLFMGEHDLKQVKHQSYLGQEATTPTYWSLPETRYQNQVKVARQPRQHMILKVESQPHQTLKVATVKDYPQVDAKLGKLRNLVWNANPQYYMRESEVLGEIEARRQALEDMPQKMRPALRGAFRPISLPNE